MLRQYLRQSHAAHRRDVPEVRHGAAEKRRRFRSPVRSLLTLAAHIVCVLTLSVSCTLTSPGSNNERATADALRRSAAASPTATATPIPTATPAPTPTPAPTATPSPIASPRTTASPAPLTAEERQYVDTVRQQTQVMETSALKVQSLMNSPQFFDPTWKAAVTTELDTWRRISRQAATLTPPPSYAVGHAKLLEAMAQFTSAADDLQAGIDRLQISLMLQAQTKAERGRDLYGEALDLMPDRGAAIRNR